MFGQLGWQELLLVLLIVLVLFGAGRVAVIMRDLGRGVRSFKEELGKKPDVGVSAGEGEEAQKENATQAKD